MAHCKDPIQELKTRAEILHKEIAAGNAEARARLRTLSELAKASDDALSTAAGEVRHKHCLAIVAREHGFTSWLHATRVLGGVSDERDFGTLLYDPGSAGALNVWISSYDDARTALEEARQRGEIRYLLCHRHQFFLVESPFIRSLGWDPNDPDWRAIGFDWARPGDAAARQRLYAKRIDATRRRR